MAQKTCQDVFHKACIARVRHPLPFGDYKLRECYRRLQQTGLELDKIQKLVSGRGSKWSLMHCTSEDKHIWLKALPDVIAWRLGYEVLPGLKALSGNGIPQAEIDLAYPTIERETLELLPRLDFIRRLVKRDIGKEYQQMRLGTPLLRPLVEEAESLALTALQVSLFYRLREFCE